MTSRIRTDLFVQLGAADPGRAPGEDVPGAVWKGAGGRRGAPYRSLSGPLRSTMPVRIACRWIRCVRPPSRSATGFRPRSWTSCLQSGRTAGRQGAQCGPDAAGTGRLRRVCRRLALPARSGCRDARGRGGGTRPPHRRAPAAIRCASIRLLPWPWRSIPGRCPHNLGDDPVRAAAYEFANYAYVMKHADEWIGEEDADYTFRSLVQASVMESALLCVRQRLGQPRRRLSERKVRGRRAADLSLRSPATCNAGRCDSCSNGSKSMSWLDNERLNKDVVEVVSLGEYCRDMLSDVIFKSLSTLDLSASKSDDPNAGRCDGRSLPLYPAGCRRGAESTEVISPCSTCC